MDAGRVGSIEDYERARILAGVPAMGREITTATIPAETGVLERSASFTKGCYTGQELVARIDSRGGNVPRHVRVLRTRPPGPRRGTHVEHDGRDVGEVTSAAAEGGGSVALAVLARSVVPPASGDRRRRGRPVVGRGARAPELDGAEAHRHASAPGRRWPRRDLPPIATTSSWTIARPSPDQSPCGPVRGVTRRDARTRGGGPRARCRVRRRRRRGSRRCRRGSRGPSPV